MGDVELKQARVAQVPEGWKLRRVGDTMNICNNLRKPISKTERKLQPGPYPYYGPTKVQDWINEYRLDGEYVLIGEDGDHFLKYASMSMTQLISGKCNVNNHAHILIGSASCLNGWFYYYFQNRDITKFLSRQGAGRYKLNKAALELLPMLVPPVSEQRAITRALSTWDKAIVIAEELIDNSKAQKTALMQQLLTGKRRFPGFVQKDESFDTPFGPVPADWQYVPIGEVATQLTEKNVEGRDLRVLSCTKHGGLVDSLAYFKKQIFSTDTSSYRIVPKGSFAYATNHIDEGSIGYQDLFDVALISPMYTVFLTTDAVEDGYLYRLLKTEHYRQIFAARTNASVNRRGSLRWKDFAKLKIPLPPMKEQVKISQTIDCAERLISSSVENRDSLATQKKALMQQLLTGARRVSVVEHGAPPATAAEG